MHVSWRNPKECDEKVATHPNTYWSLGHLKLNRIEAFQLWTPRRLLLRRAPVERQLIDTVEQHKLSYLGHILRRPRYSIPKLILQEKIESRLGPGRKQFFRLRNIRN